MLRDLGKSIDDLFAKSKNSKEDMKKELDERIEENIGTIRNSMQTDFDIVSHRAYCW